MFSTEKKGVRYMEMAEGYVTHMALDKDEQVIGYEFIKAVSYTHLDVYKRQI